MMTEAPPQPRALAAPVLGLACAMISAVVLCLAWDHIFFTLPALNRIWDSVDVRRTWSSQFVSANGLWFGGVLVVGTATSLWMAWRRPGRPSTLAFSLVVLGASIWLAVMVNRAAWSPILNLMLDLADPAREVPRYD